MTVAIRKQDIRSACGDRAYARGVDYQRNGHVVDIQTIPSLDGLIIRASVSGGSLYRQEITVFDFDEVVEIEGSCSCPVGYNCKHVAAVLTSMLEETQPAPLARQRQQIDHEVVCTDRSMHGEAVCSRLDATTVYCTTRGSGGVARTQVPGQLHGAGHVDAGRAAQ